VIVPSDTNAPSLEEAPDYGDPDSVGFWRWCQRGELRIQRCDECELFIHFPAPICPRCLSLKTHWAKVSGLGRIYAMTVIHHAISEAFKSQVPYVVAWIELEEQSGLRLLANVVDSDTDAVRIGASVEVKFVRGNTGLLLPAFAPSLGEK
jgi:uncharacterized protein